MIRSLLTYEADKQQDRHDSPQTVKMEVHQHDRSIYRHSAAGILGDDAPTDARVLLAVGPDQHPHWSAAFLVQGGSHSANLSHLEVLNAPSVN